MRILILLSATIVLALAAACGGKNTYTLYRNGSLSDTLRIHVATFDADENADDNRDNCEQVRELFQLHPAATSRFWCESGRYHKKAPR